ncbi:hypothetical protein KSF_088190 [Reticulibacter mediterranei]|uniref:Uncharacterized protein n=1 Tax=Reticulibacter mediterranei TaxID=2778369 RepID=A0A8J3IQ93_9CHLR|nr:hypothetical protein [Reticulibacter mediterranei]GHO98771.1 hypothetical protein KSF_088190 [Reticulibacter mediterranei]
MQLATCKARGAIIDETVTSPALVSQDNAGVAVPSQEDTLQASDTMSIRV